ncbi:MAG: integrase [Hyphomicrobiales bacterium]|nr:integrase [Hyphomicrobiales bacterium]
MATMISEVYDASIAAGAPEEKARKAAEAIASAEARFARIDADLLLLKWMVGFNLAFKMAIMARVFWR